MKIIFVFALSLLALGIKAQDNSNLPGGKDQLGELKQSMDSAALYKVEMESQYPGGFAGWNNFLQRVMRYPDNALRNGIQGMVMVQFVVDKDGKVSDIHATSGPLEGGLREEAEGVIKKSGKWIPAIQHAKYVKSYKMQPFSFKLN